MDLYVHPAGGWTIRPLQRADLMAVQDLFIACLEEFPWRGPVRNELVRLRRTFMASEQFVAEEPQAGLIGFISLEAHKSYIPHLFVDPDWRFAGVGRGLLGVAREMCGRSLSLDVDIQNKGARAAYAAMGWSERVKAERGARAGNQVRLVGP